MTKTEQVAFEKTTVLGLRDGINTAGTALMLRQASALGATVAIARTGRVTVTSPTGGRRVYVLVVDRTTGHSPLRQALADLQRGAGAAAEQNARATGLTYEDR